jgi:hypothetical protein
VFATTNSSATTAITNDDPYKTRLRPNRFDI